MSIEACTRQSHRACHCPSWIAFESPCRERLSLDGIRPPYATPLRSEDHTGDATARAASRRNRLGSYHTHATWCTTLLPWLAKACGHVLLQKSVDKMHPRSNPSRIWETRMCQRRKSVERASLLRISDPHVFQYRSYKISRFPAA